MPVRAHVPPFDDDNDANVLSCEYKVSQFHDYFRSVYFLDFFCSFFMFLHNNLLLKCLIEFTNKK